MGTIEYLAESLGMFVYMDMGCVELYDEKFDLSLRFKSESDAMSYLRTQLRCDTRGEKAKEAARIRSDAHRCRSYIDDVVEVIEKG